MSGIGLSQFLRFGPGRGAKPWRLHPSFSQKSSLGNASQGQISRTVLYGSEPLHPGSFGPQSFVIQPPFSGAFHIGTTYPPMSTMAVLTVGTLIVSPLFCI